MNFFIFLTPFLLANSSSSIKPTDIREMYVGMTEHISNNIDEVYIENNSLLTYDENNNTLLAAASGECQVTLISENEEVTYSYFIKDTPTVSSLTDYGEIIVTIREGQEYDLNIENIDLFEGDYLELTSTDENIATIENDIVSAHSIGQCYINLEIKGEHEYNFMSITIEVEEDKSALYITIISVASSLIVIFFVVVVLVVHFLNKKHQSLDYSSKEINRKKK